MPLGIASKRQHKSTAGFVNSVLYDFLQVCTVARESAEQAKHRFHQRTQGLMARLFGVMTRRRGDTSLSFEH